MKERNTYTYVSHLIPDNFLDTFQWSIDYYLLYTVKQEEIRMHAHLFICGIRVVERA